MKEFEGYQYNDCDVCLNPTIFAKYDDNKSTNFKLSYSKTEKGYVTGVSIMTGPPDYHGSGWGCSYNYSKAFTTEQEAKIYCIDCLTEFLQKQIEGKKGIAEAIQNAKEFKMSIMYKQLELF